MNGPLRGLSGSLKMFANWVQLEIRIGLLIGPPGSRPMNAATEVATPSIGLLPMNFFNIDTRRQVRGHAAP